MYQQQRRGYNYSHERMRRELIEKSRAAESHKKAKKKKQQFRRRAIVFVIFALIIGGLAARFFIIANPLKIPGKIYYDETLTEDEENALTEIFKDYIGDDAPKVLNHDVTFTAKTTTSKIEEKNTILYNLELPTVDFYSNELNVTESEANSKKVTWKSLEAVTPEDRVVSINDKYYFDTLNEGAKYRYLKIDSIDPDESKTILEEKLKEQGKNYPTDKSQVLSFAQTGVTALTRAMTNTLNGRANGRGSYFADNIKDFLSKNDLTHISNEVSFTDNCKGGRDTMSLCADWRALDTITAIGTNIVELTGNHNNNYGFKANIETIQKYQSLGIKTFGGGINETEAAKPLELNEKGQKITLLGYNESTSTKANNELADGENPGANGYTDEKAVSDIKTAKARGDFVIVDVQFSECYSYPDGYSEMPECDAPIAGQKRFFRNLIDLGADMIIGTQAHHPQTFEYYEGKPIYYGLGNLFFDQTYWPGTQRGYILTHYFINNKLINTRISPTWYDENHQVYLTNEQTSENFIKRLVEASPKGE